MAVSETPKEDAMTFEIHSITSLYGAVAMTRRLPFMEDLSDQDKVLIATVVSELGTNILKYAGRGEIRVHRTIDEGHEAIQVVAEDRGGGIANIPQAMQEHYSTSGTLGMGLPAINRMMTTMVVECGEGEGTRIVTSKWLNGETARPRLPAQEGCNANLSGATLASFDIGQSIRPMQGEQVSGDISVVAEHPQGLLAGLIDVSGHGTEAHELACRMQQTVLNHDGAGIDKILQRLHHDFRGSRGAAIGLTILDRTRRKITYAGVGNISIWRIGKERWRGVSRDGIIGQIMHSLFVQEASLEIGDLVALTSDGISETTTQHLCGLYRNGMMAQDFSDLILRVAGKNHDDASCLILRCLH
ncbi:MAG: ATP-binding protein [Cyanobacteriota bacterium]|nr:ATP-binding protein [Cyanobacteriota bacterium]